MRHTSKVRNGHLRVELLEDRVQPGSLWFGDIFPSEAIFGDSIRGSSHHDDQTLLSKLQTETDDLVLLGAGAREQLANVTTSPAQTVITMGSSGAAFQPSAQPAGAVSMTAAAQTQIAVQVVQATGLNFAGQGGVQSTQRSRELVRQAEALPVEAMARPAIVTNSNLSVNPVDYLQTTVTTCGGGGADATAFATFKGGAELDAMNGVDIAADTTFAAGVTTSEGVTSMLLSVVDSAGGCTDIAITATDGASIQANAIAAISDGSGVYLGGQNTTTGTALLLRYDADGTLGGVEFAGTGAVPLSINGVSLTAAGTVLVTGRGEDEVGQGNILLGEFDAVLSLPPIHAVGIGFMGSLASEGFSVDSDGDGNVYVGGRDDDGVSTDGVFLRVNADWATFGWAFGWVNPGAGGGNMTAGVRGVKVDGTSLYMAGTLANGLASPQDGTDLVLAKVPLTTGIPPVWAWRWYVGEAGVSTGDFGGYDIGVDSAGSPYVAISIAGAPDPVVDTDGGVVKFGPGGNTIAGSTFFANPLLEEKTERGLGVALVGTNNFAFAGLTNSPDLQVDEVDINLLNACQPDYGEGQDGFIGRNV